MASSIENRFQAACNAKEIAGAILVAQDVTGKFNYAKTFGTRTTIDGSEKEQKVDDVLFMASCTKLLTTIAVLQCVEQGLISMTADVSRIVPELSTVQVLIRMGKDGSPVLENKSSPITTRQLLTHSSGFRYDMIDPLLQEWRKSRGEQPISGLTVEDRFNFPLSFQPGSAWSYGIGLDWAGKIVERIMKLTLEDYMQKYIFDPLGISESTFWPMKKEGLKERMVDYSTEDPKGVGLAVAGGVDLRAGATDCFGGHGMYSTAPDYLKVLCSILLNDGKLLKKETVDSMFEPQLSSDAKKSMQDTMSNPLYNVWFAQSTPLKMERDWGLGGLLFLEDTPGAWGNPTMAWGGGINSAWFIDRANGLCGFGAPQLLLPTNLPKAEEMKQLFRKGIYEVYNSWKASQ